MKRTVKGEPRRMSMRHSLILAMVVVLFLVGVFYSRITENVYRILEERSTHKQNNVLFDGQSSIQEPSLNQETNIRAWSGVLTEQPSNLSTKPGNGDEHLTSMEGTNVGGHEEQDPAATTEEEKVPVARKPHIIFVLADDLGWNDVGFHNPQIHTPHLDRLAREGVQLGNYYAQPNCSPSRATLMTGKYSARNGIQHAFRPWNPSCLPLFHKILPQKLKEIGYSTHLVGKWHLGFCREECLPQNRGFDSFFGMREGSNDLFSHMKTAKGRSGYDLFDNNRPAYEFKGQYSALIYGQRAEKIIRQKSRTDEPLFILLSLQVPHTPQIVPQTYIDRWPSYKNVTYNLRRRYMGQVSCMDDVVSKLKNTLIEQGMWNNTIFIFSSDNGGAKKYGGTNTPLRDGKRSFYDGGVRVAGFVHSDLLSSSVRGTVYNGLMGMVDWLPTFVNGIGGGIMNDSIDGMNMWPSIRDGVSSPREDYILSVGEECAGKPRRNLTSRWDETGVDPRSSIRSGPWKLIIMQSKANTDSEVLLYNLETDPTEETNVAEQNPDVVTSLRQRIREYCPLRVPPVPFGDDGRYDPNKTNRTLAPWGCTISNYPDITRTFS